MEYSQIILNFMDSNEVTGYRMAKATGISESLFGKWRSKPTSKIDATTLTKISNYFGISIDELIGNEQKNKPSTEVKGFSADAVKLLERIEKWKSQEQCRT